MTTIDTDWDMKINERKFSREVGQRIARFRKEQGLTQQQLADAIGVRQYAIARFEVGFCRVPVGLLSELARILGVTADDLLGTPPAKLKPGPAPKLQKQIEKISSLPREQQKTVLQVLEMALNSAS